MSTDPQSSGETRHHEPVKQLVNLESYVFLIGISNHNANANIVHGDVHTINNNNPVTNIIYRDVPKELVSSVDVF